MPEGIITGVKNFHIAYMNEDGTYTVPEFVSYSMNIGVTPSVATASLAGDNAIRATASKLTKITLAVELNNLPLQQRAKVFGHKYENGQEIVTSSDVPPYIACGFEYTKDNGNSRLIWLYKGKAQEPSDTVETEGENINFQTPTITIECVARDDGAFKYTLDMDDDTHDPTKVTDWYTAVQEFTPGV